MVWIRAGERSGPDRNVCETVWFVSFAAGMMYAGAELEPSTEFRSWLGVSETPGVNGGSGKPSRIPGAMDAGGPGRPPRVDVQASRFHAVTFGFGPLVSTAPVIEIV